MNKFQWKRRGYISTKDFKLVHRQMVGEEVVFEENSAEKAKKEEDKQFMEKKKREREAEKEKNAGFIKCPACGKAIRKDEAARNHYICYECGSYFRVKTRNRLSMLIDAKSFQPLFENMPINNPLNFSDYEEKVQNLKEELNLDEAITIGTATLKGEEVMIGVCDSKFLMGSMGHIVGEKIALAFEEATKKRLPVILFCCSGGARMQEGIISLMQMAKTAAACKKHSDAGLLYIPILTDPTTGGVTASFAMLGDIILAEPGALIGFAGPRVIEQTIGQKLPKGFQRAEFLLEHGIIDGVVKREDLKETLYQLLKMHRFSGKKGMVFSNEKEHFRASEIALELSQTAEKKGAWDKVKIARSMERPTTLDYVSHIFTDFVEMHGDRHVWDDKAIVGGVAFLEETPVTVIGVQKGSTSEECAKRNYGMPSPEGYRKALRLMKQAEKFGRPIITFVNTAGAYPGMTAEERGQGEAIARNLYEMATLTVPVLTIIIGEGGSGGALALSVGNEVWMLENSTYSILSPEGFSSILWKNKNGAKEAAEVMKITAEDLYKLQVIEKIIPEYGVAGKDTMGTICGHLKQEIEGFLERFAAKSKEEIVEERIERFRKF